MIRTLTAAALLTLSLATALPAGIALADPAVAIRFGDLDLSQPGDANILAGRVHTAAEAACVGWKPRGAHSSSLFYISTYNHCIAMANRKLTDKVMAMTTRRSHYASN